MENGSSKNNGLISVSSHKACCIIQPLESTKAYQEEKQTLVEKMIPELQETGSSSGSVINDFEYVTCLLWISISTSVN